MCGIVGVVNKSVGGLFASDVELFSQLLYIDALRGEDSTGVIGYQNNGDMHVIKDALDARDFIKTDEFNKIAGLSAKTGKALIGHNRKKTVGKIDPTTAHPFVIDNRFAFVHNGTLYSHKHLADTEVDSEALGIHLAACEGDKAKLEKALEHVYGAYACAWVDQKEEKLYLLRNADRPLYICESAGCYFFASENTALAHVLIRNGNKLDKIDKVKENTLYIIDLSNKEAISGYQEVTLSVKKYQAPTTTGHTVGGNTGTTEFKGLFQEGTSKNGFKKFKREWVGALISFYIYDYFPLEASDCQNWLITGESFLLPNFDHEITGYVRGLDEEQMQEFSEGLLMGQVKDVTWDSSTKTMKIEVAHIMRNKYYSGDKK